MNKNTQRLRNAAKKAFHSYKKGLSVYPSNLPPMGHQEPLDKQPKVARSASDIMRRLGDR